MKQVVLLKCESNAAVNDLNLIKRMMMSTHRLNRFGALGNVLALELSTFALDIVDIVAQYVSSACVNLSNSALDPVLLCTFTPPGACVNQMAIDSHDRLIVLVLHCTSWILKVRFFFTALCLLRWGVHSLVVWTMTFGRFFAVCVFETFRKPNRLHLSSRWKKLSVCRANRLEIRWTHSKYGH